MGAAATTPAGRKLVLGVEPDPVTRALVALYLEPHGYRVQLAASVADALEALPSSEAALFLCSEVAVGSAGRAERERLREALEGLPVVVLLEPGMPLVMLRHWEGVREHLTKPLSAVSLLGVLQARAFRSGDRAPAGWAPAAGGDGLLAGFEALVAEMEMDEAMVRELVDSFLERAPAYLSEMTEAIAAGDLERVDRAAHTMKGMCGNLRFGPLVAASERLRATARRGDTGAAGHELDRLKAAYDDLQAAMRGYWTAAD